MDDAMSLIATMYSELVKMYQLHSNMHKIEYKTEFYEDFNRVLTLLNEIQTRDKLKKALSSKQRKTRIVHNIKMRFEQVHDTFLKDIWEFIEMQEKDVLTIEQKYHDIHSQINASIAIKVYNALQAL